MKKFGNAIWCAVLAVAIFVCYKFVPALHMDGMIYAGFILLGATVAYLQDAFTGKKDKKRFSNTIWCAVFAVVVFACYFLIPALHYDGFVYAGCILAGATAAYLQDAVTGNKGK